MVREQSVWQGKTYTLTWEPGSVVPKGEVTQASALCFTDDGLNLPRFCVAEIKRL